MKKKFKGELKKDEIPLIKDINLYLAPIIINNQMSVKDEDEGKRIREKFTNLNMKVPDKDFNLTNILFDPIFRTPKLNSLRSNFNV